MKKMRTATMAMILTVAALLSITCIAAETEEATDGLGRTNEISAFAKLGIMRDPGTLTSTTPISVDLDATPPIELSIPNQQYTGEEISIQFTVTSGTNQLTEGSDYTIGYTGERTNVTAESEYVTVNITGINTYSGKGATGNFKIVPKDIRENGVTIREIDDQTYTGSPIVPDVIITYGQLTLSQNNGGTGDFKVTCTENTNVSNEVTATIEGTGNYTGTVSKTFRIVPKNIGNDDVTIREIDDQTYTGSVIEPDVSMTYNGIVLVKNADYTLSYNGDTTNVTDAGVTVTVVGKGNYGGNKTVTYKIVPKDIAGLECTTDATQTYTGSVIEPDVSMTYNGIVLMKNADYTLSYSDNNISATPEGDSVTVTATGKGNYTGSAKATFRIIQNISSLIVGDPLEAKKGESVTLDIELVRPGPKNDAEITISYNERLLGTVKTDEEGKAKFTFDPSVSGIANGTFQELSVDYAGDNDVEKSHADAYVIIVGEVIEAEGQKAEAHVLKDEATSFKLGNGSSIIVTVTGETGGIRVPVIVEIKEAEPDKKIPKSERTFDITITVGPMGDSGGSLDYTAAITLPISIPSTMRPVVTSYNDDGTVKQVERIISHNRNSVTFETDHNTLFAVSFVRLPVFPGSDPRADDVPVPFPQPQTPTQSSEKDDDGAKVAILVGAISVVLISIFALQYMRKE